MDAQEKIRCKSYNAVMHVEDDEFGEHRCRRITERLHVQRKCTAP